MFQRILDWVYSPKCLSCTEVMALGKDRWFCASCKDTLERVEGRVCEKCGRLATQPMCQDCLLSDHGYAKNRSVFLYDENMRKIIHRFKFDNHPEYGKALGAIMANYLKDEYEIKPDYIVPVPMYKKKVEKRGFNHAEILSRTIARELKIQHAPRLIFRIRETAPQYELSKSERVKNLDGAFMLDKNLRNKVVGKTILIVDDIYTTGSTMSQCSGVFMENGATAVYGLCLAAAVKRNP